MALKNVELVRQRAASGIKNELVRFRVWLSMTDGNLEGVDRLTENQLAEILAVVVENLISHIGHDTALSASAEDKGRRSQASKTARRFA